MTFIMLVEEEDMAICVICNKNNPVAAPVMTPPCPNCGFNSSRSDDSIKAVAAKIGQMGTAKVQSESTANAILANTGSDPLAQMRVKRLLRIMLFLHSGAEMIANLVFEATPPRRRDRIQAVDNALRGQDPGEGGGQEILGNLNYTDLSADKKRLVLHCSQGWEATKRKWATLPPDYRAHFIQDLFEHDKGYPQTLRSALNYIKPEDQSMDLALINILQSSCGMDPYTGKGTSQTDITWGERIRDGWAGSSPDGRKMMWATFMAKIANAMSINLAQANAGAAIVAQLQANRDDVVEQLGNFIAEDTALDFVNASALTSWTAIMG
jgi:predicted RNA-binding Zn-ribbon protein involved in translation (DUF1610 family)